MKKLFLATTALVALAAGPAHADPISAAVAWVGSTLAAGGIGAMALRFVGGLALNAIGTALQKRQAGSQGANVSFQVEMGDDLPLSFVMGNYATAGKRKYIGSWGKNTRFITEVIEYSALPQGLAGLWVNDERGEFIEGQRAWIGGADPSDDTSWSEGSSVPSGSIDIGRPLSNLSDDGNRIVVKVLDGTQAAADPFLVRIFGNDPDYPWTASHIGRGKSYVIVTTRYDSESLTQYPTFLWEPAPLPVYDWRFDSTNGGDGPQRWGDRSTYQPSLNPAVLAYNIARGIHWGGEWVFGGKNLAGWRLPVAEWTAAANACDQTVTLANGSTQPRYRAGVEIAVDMEPASVLEELGKAANMKFAEVGGRLKPIVDLPGAAVFSFSDGDILISEGQSFNPFYPISETFNAISATYPEPGEKWASKDAPEFIHAAATADDGGQYLPTSMQYGAVPFARQVQRLMRSQMRDFRRMRRHQFYLPPDAYALEPGIDMVSWTSERNGYINKQFMVESVNKTPGMNVLVSLREVDPSDYDWSSDFEMPVIITPPVNPKPFVQPINGLSAVGVIIRDEANNARRPAIGVGCNGDEAGVTDIQIRARVLGQTENSIETTRRYDEPFLWHLLNVIPDTQYQVQARLLSDLTPKSVWSSWIDVTTPDVRLGSGDVDVEVIKEEVRDDLGGYLEWIDETGEVIRSVRDEIDAIRDAAAEQDFGNLLARDQIRETLAVEVGSARAEFNDQIDVVVGDLAAQATRTTTLRAEFNSTTAVITERQNVFASDQLAAAQRITTLEADLGEATASFTEQIDAIVTDQEAAAIRTSELEANIDDTAVRVATEEIARANADSALGARIDSVEASVGDAVGSATQGLVTRIETVEGELTVQSDAITETSAKVGRVSASGLIRMTSVAAPSGAQTRVAIAAEAADGASSQQAALFLDAATDGTNQIVAAANRFAVATGTGPAATRDIPFLIDDGRVYMDIAFIKNLSVGRLKIQDEAATTFPYAYRSAAIRVEAQDSWTTIQTLSFTKGRNAPMPVYFRADVAAGTFDDLVGSIRLLRDGVEMRLYSLYRKAPGEETAGPNEFRFTDIDSQAGPVTYTLQARRKVGISGDFVDLSHCFIGVLNAYK